VREREGSGNAWNIGEIAKTLSVEPERVHDVVIGEGTRLPVGATSIEIFPDVGLARLVTRSARIELYRLGAPTADENGVIFENHRPGEAVRASVTPQGIVNLTIGPSREAATQLVMAEDQDAADPRSEQLQRPRCRSGPRLRTEPV